MLELLQESFTWVNIIPTTLFAFTLVYWLIVAVGFLDVDTVDVDVDIDIDADADIDVDADATSVGWLNHVLAFFNLADIPLMVFLSFFALPLWAAQVLLNHYTGNSSFIISLVFLAIGIFCSLFFAKFATLPFVKIFRTLKKSTENTDPVGKICTLLMPASDGRLAQAELKDGNNNLRITVRVPQGKSLNKGETALVIERLSDKNAYLIEPYNPT